ncbi:MAG: pilus assembly protein PilM [Candidatus Omnitrophota bacterium]
MKRIISIDIGSALTKIIEVFEHKNTFELVTLEAFPTPVSGTEIDDALFFERLTKNISLSRLKSATLVLAVPASATSFAFLDLPKLPQNELSKVIDREARRKIFPVPEEKDIIKDVYAGTIHIKDEIQERRLIGAASRQVVTKYMELFAKKNITPAFIGSTPLALMQHNLTSQSAASSNLAFIDIGSKHTSIAVFKKNDIALIRSIPFACSNFIESISKKLQIPLAQAEVLFLKEEAEDATTADSWEYLLAELRRSFTYYKDITGGSRIDGMVFSGGMMTFKKPAEYLRRNMGGNLEIFQLKSSRYFNTAQFTPADLITRGPLFATAFGLLAATKAKIPSINFIPSEVLHEAKVKRIKFFSIKALMLIMAVSVLVNIGISVNNTLMTAKLAKLKNSFPQKEFSAVMKKAAEINALADELAQDKRINDGLLRSEPPITRLFDILSESVSPATYINEISIDYAETNTQKQPEGPEPKTSIFAPQQKEGSGGVFQSGNSASEEASAITVKMRGNIVSDYETAQKELASLHKKLLDSGIFSAITYKKLKVEEITIGAKGQNHTLTKVTPREFTIEGKVKIQ